MVWYPSGNLLVNRALQTACISHSGITKNVCGHKATIHTCNCYIIKAPTTNIGVEKGPKTRLATRKVDTLLLQAN